MKRWLVLVAMAALTMGADAGPSLNAVVRGDVAKGFSGAVLVARGDTLLLDRAYGAGLTPHSRFWIASAGKQFVSAAILKCAERGWLSLDDKLARFFPDAPADKRDITIRQLLAHLSGLDQTYASEGTTTRDAAVAAMLSKPMIDRPGLKFHYSNDNYQLAAAIVEVASGTDYRSFVTRVFFQPLGLRDTGFNFSDGAKRVAPTKAPLPPRLQKPAWGEAGVYSSTHDLFRWYRALQAHRVLRDPSPLFTAVTPIGEGQAAFNWFLGKTARGTATIFTRGNDDFGANALIYAYPAKDTVIVILTHAGDANDDASWSRFVLKQLGDALNL
ncbi:MAG: beta-lactamase family protein [Alphaproteobacteria bacterium]|nr:beta-lactamase family protein [Alphaproteobacteria bacterium]